VYLGVEWWQTFQKINSSRLRETRKYVTDGWYNVWLSLQFHSLSEISTFDNLTSKAHCFWCSITRQVWSWCECRLATLVDLLYADLVTLTFDLCSGICCLRYSQSMSFALLHQLLVGKLWHISSLSITRPCDFDLLTSVLLRQLHVTWVMSSMLGFIKLFPELRTGMGQQWLYQTWAGGAPQKHHHETYRSRIRWWIVRNIRVVVVSAVKRCKECLQTTSLGDKFPSPEPLIGPLQTAIRWFDLLCTGCVIRIGRV